DLFVMPSRARLDHDDVEGFGMVFLEASACAKPVIGGRSGGIADAISEGETGLLVDPEDPAELAAAVRVAEAGTLAQQLEGANHPGGARQLVEGEEAQRVAHDHRHPRPQHTGVAEPAQRNDEGGEAEIGLGLAAARREEQQIGDFSVRMATVDQPREGHQDERQLERPPRRIRQRR
ncbi:MAG: glycosyltransferase family 4 protein, partial [Bryobacterales bacterium]|nr:glycosyltransferase family 4 protein [Bryobacterales bacterium]